MTVPNLNPWVLIVGGNVAAGLLMRKSAAAGAVASVATLVYSGYAKGVKGVLVDIFVGGPLAFTVSGKPWPGQVPKTTEGSAPVALPVNS